MTGKVNAFDVLKSMGERNMDIFLAPMINLIGIKKVKGGYEVSMGVPDEIGLRMVLGETFSGGLILANHEQFLLVNNELEAEIDRLNAVK